MGPEGYPPANSENFKKYPRTYVRSSGNRTPNNVMNRSASHFCLSKPFQVCAAGRPAIQPHNETHRFPRVSLMVDIFGDTLDTVWPEAVCIDVGRDDDTAVDLGE